MARKTARSKETPEQTLARWQAGAAKRFVGYGELMDLGWEAGMDGYIEVYGMHYERFDLPDGGYVVVEWDYEGNIGVC